MTWLQESMKDGYGHVPLCMRVEAAREAIVEAARGSLNMAEAVERAMPEDVEKLGSCPCEEGNALVLEDLETGEAVVIRLAGEAGLLVEEAMPAVTAEAPAQGLVKSAEAAKGKKIVRERRYRAGYVIRDEIWQTPDGREQLMERQAYTPDGDWIGDSVWAYRLTALKGIAPEKADPSHSVCSIGYCAQERKWYGWSHRAMCGFGIGDRVFDPKWPKATEKTPPRRHGDEVIQSLEQAKEAAKTYARDVS